MGAAEKDSGCNSMRVGLIDVDGHNFPNIPLMKLSAWHKQQGDTVEWYEPLFSGHMNEELFEICMNGDDAQFKKGITELQKAQNEYILQKERENG